MKAAVEHEAGEQAMNFGVEARLSMLNGRPGARKAKAIPAAQATRRRQQHDRATAPRGASGPAARREDTTQARMATPQASVDEP
jgi:hypothetical protein